MKRILTTLSIAALTATLFLATPPRAEATGFVRGRTFVGVGFGRGFGFGGFNHVGFNTFGYGGFGFSRFGYGSFGLGGYGLGLSGYGATYGGCHALALAPVAYAPAVAYVPQVAYAAPAPMIEAPVYTAPAPVYAAAPCAPLVTLAAVPTYGYASLNYGFLGLNVHNRFFGYGGFGFRGRSFGFNRGFVNVNVVNRERIGGRRIFGLGGRGKVVARTTTRTVVRRR